MSQHDLLQRFMFNEAPVRGELVHLDASWQAVLERHPYPPPVRKLLGELMVSALLLSATLKYDGKMIMQLHGAGPVRLLVVECTSGKSFRGLAQWEGEVPADGMLRDATGAGKIAITLEPATGTQRYQSIVEIEGGSIAQALEQYLARSEQIETRMWVASSDHSAAGLLVQRLPGSAADDDTWNRVGHLASTVTDSELLGLPFEELLYRLFHDEAIAVFESEPVSFRCSCSRERVADMLRSLGRAEVQDILAQEGSVKVSCEFCNRAYVFDPVDAQTLFAETAPGLSSTRH